jgi:hypothetical protein
MIDFGDRAAALVRSWPRTSAIHVRDYVRRHAVHPARPTRRQPIWLLLPIWLHERFTPRRAPFRSRQFLADVLWAQFCLFLFIRIQDDVLDGQTAPRMLFVADEFLLESQRVFSTMPLPAFHAVVSASLSATIRGILRANALQRGAGLVRRQWVVYAQVGSIFKVASAAVCRAGLHEREFAAVSRFLDHVAIADQILDDLRDLDEDLRDRRINAAARWLLGADCRDDGIRERVGAAIFHTDRVELLIRAVDSHVRHARSSIGRLDLPAAPAFLDALDRQVAAALQRTHAARVDALVGRWLGGIGE